MPGRIEHDAHELLRLVLGLPGAQPFGSRDGGVEVVDPDVEMQLHLLIARARGPARLEVLVLALEGEPDLTLARLRLDHDPVGVVVIVAVAPTQELHVERGEPARVRSAEDGVGQAEGRCTHASTLGRQPGPRKR